MCLYKTQLGEDAWPYSKCEHSPPRGSLVVHLSHVTVQGVLVSPRMVEDHSCLALQAALRLALKPAGADAPAASAVAEYFPPVVPPREEDENKSPV